MSELDKALSCIKGCQQYHDQYGKCSGRNCILCRRYDTIREQIQLIKDAQQKGDEQ